MALPPVLRLRVGQEAFLISGPKKTLFLSRTSPSIREVDGAQASVTGEEQDIFGIIGIINLVSGRHLMVIKGCALVGSIEGEILPFQPTKPSPLTPAQQQDEATYLRMLNFLLRVPTLYFSLSFDLTNSAQRRMLGSETDNAKPLWRRADTRFFWNRYVLEELIVKELDAWIVPLLFGFISISALTILGKSIDLVLISRRNVKRAGTRYYTRGVDAEGNVANNVETELISYTDTAMWSFVQTRGSIPIFWSQFPNIRYKPKVVLNKNESASLAFNRHFEEQQRRYGRQVIINLVDQKPKSGEALLEQEYRRHSGLFSTTSAKTTSTPLKYIAFDFHKQCAKMKYENLSVLLREYFRAEVTTTARTVTNTQKGALRTNCIDNLDRTNVVQAMHARHALVAQLRRTGFIKSGLEEAPTLEKTFKNIWADNADAVSRQYSGTGALKNDFTRTGKRNMRGVLNDGVNSMVRYYLNNFVDGFRQDAYDLFLGNYVVDPSRPSPFPSPREKMIYAALLAVALFMFLAGIFFFPGGQSSIAWRVLFVVFWLLALFIVWKVLLKDGRVLVNRPALVKPT